MPERKAWTPEEDKILKLLRQGEKEMKWADISRKMEEDYNIVGRSGKQCRQRYHNHLASNIVSAEWSREQESILFALHDELGNKWALISSKLPGRTDNCVKNHFYSKLRKGVRKLNKIIQKQLKKQYKEIKNSTLYKIIEIMECNYKNQIVINEQTFQLCKKIKNCLKAIEDIELDRQEQIKYIRQIIEAFAVFDKEIKKPQRRRKSSIQKTQLLHPNFLTSSGSIKSRSIHSKSSKSSKEDSDSHLSNSQFLSSESYFESDFDYNQIQKKSAKRSTKDRARSSESSSSQNNKKSKQNLFYSLQAGMGQLNIAELQRGQSASSKSSKEMAAQSEFKYDYADMLNEDTPMFMRVYSPKVSADDIFDLQEDIFKMNLNEENSIKMRIPELQMDLDDDF